MIFKKQLLLLILMPAFIGLGSCSSTPNQENSANVVSNQQASFAETVELSALAEVLSDYVDEQGLVDYKALQKERQQLDTFNQSLQDTELSTYGSWSDAEKIAFLVNAYNSLTLKAIINESPIKASIKDILGVWRLNTHPILQDKKTLDNIEHDLLRANFNEPRIHAALVCAAISCPYLRREPYTGEDLDAQLDDQVEIFLSRPEAFEIDRENNQVRLSAIFKWFGKDWIPSFGTDEGFAGNDNERAVLNFISGYLEEEDRTYLQAGNYKVTYIDYDWSLNIQK